METLQTVHFQIKVPENILEQETEVHIIPYQLVHDSYRNILLVYFSFNVNINHTYKSIIKV